MADPGTGVRMALAPALAAAVAVRGGACSSPRSACAQILVADGLVIVQVRGEIDDEHGAGAFAAELTGLRAPRVGVVGGTTSRMAVR